jgi:catechol 2,3-dioxygenase-like lactoylglutathione lyase family enzyme
MRFNKLVPELSVSNLKKSLNFYKTILGFKIEYGRAEDRFVFLSLEGSQLMLEEGSEGKDSEWYVGKREQPFGRGIHLQIEVKNLSKLLLALGKNNYPLKSKPKERWFRKDKKLMGMYSFLVQDPDGYLFLFHQDLGNKPIKK